MMLCGKKSKKTAPSSHYDDDGDEDLLYDVIEPHEDIPSPVDSLSPILPSRNDVLSPSRRKLGSKNFGQLRLSVYANFGLLTVHVIEGRQMSCQRWKKDTSQIYVKVCFSPDESRRTKCRTASVDSTRCPIFNEKFSFELLEDDIRKRLLISVWLREEEHEHSHFLGCMSFGLQHIISQRREVNGWYHLLEEDIGRRKHLHVAGTPATQAVNPQYIPKVNQNLVWMEPKVIAIRRGLDESFGFTLVGCSPVVISRVEPGSPANQAGLQVKDCIVAVNGMNLSRSTAESISKIISNLAVKIMLEVQRPRGSVSSSSPAEEERDALPLKLKSSIRLPPVGTETDYKPHARHRQLQYCLAAATHGCARMQRVHFADHVC